MAAGSTCANGGYVSWLHKSTTAFTCTTRTPAVRLDRQPVAAFFAVVGETGPQQDRPRGLDAALDQDQGRAMVAGQPEPLGEHRPIAAAPPERRQRNRGPELRYLAVQRAAARRGGLAVYESHHAEAGPVREVADHLGEFLVKLSLGWFFPPPPSHGHQGGR